MTVKQLIRMDTSINSSSIITVILIDECGEEINRHYVLVGDIIKGNLIPDISKYKVDTFRHYSNLEIFSRG